MIEESEAKLNSFCELLRINKDISRVYTIYKILHEIHEVDNMYIKLNYLAFLKILMT